MLKKLQKIKKKQDNDVDTDVTQYECNNNKYYTSIFRYIQICHVLNFFFFLLLILWFPQKKKKKKKKKNTQKIVFGET